MNTLIIGNTHHKQRDSRRGLSWPHSTGVTIENTIVAGNTINSNGADVGDAVTPGTTGINFFGAATAAGAAAMTGTQIYGNTISGEDYAIMPTVVTTR